MATSVKQMLEAANAAVPKVAHHAYQAQDSFDENSAMPADCS